MAKDKGAANQGGGASVTPITAAVCCVEKCSAKGYKLNFCTEHYAWFKEGLVNKKGEKPSDFDKKFQAYSMRRKAA